MDKLQNAAHKPHLAVICRLFISGCRFPPRARRSKSVTTIICFGEIGYLPILAIKSHKASC